MDKDGIIGWIILAGALGLITFLVLWSIAIINHLVAQRENNKKDINMKAKGGGK